MNQNFFGNSGRGIQTSVKETKEYYDELYAIQSLYKGSIFSMETALYINMFIPNIPMRYHLSYPVYYKKFQKNLNQIEVYYVLDEQVNIGLKQGVTAFGHGIYYYDIERSLCDILTRDIQNIVSYFELFYQYQRYPFKDVKKLSCYAEMLNLKNEISYFGLV